MTKEIDKATPRPWAFEPHNGYGRKDPDGTPFPFGYISTSFPSPIFELVPVVLRPVEELRANAALIVRAVNAHDDLVAALRAVEAISDRCVNAETYSAQDALDDLQDIRSIISCSRAALAKAKGE